jgi:lysophospholipase L1-like esterase
MWVGLINSIIFSVAGAAASADSRADVPLAQPISTIAAIAPSSNWVAAWRVAPSDAFLSVSLNNQTIRQPITVHQQGRAVRLRVSNRAGRAPVTLNDVRIGVSAQDAKVQAGSSHPLRFAGQASITLAPGASAVSDPVEMTVQAMQRLAVSLYAQGRLTSVSRHSQANEHVWRAHGNQSAAEDGKAFTRINNNLQTSTLLIEGLDVLPARPTRVLVAFGDSITDGFIPHPSVPLFSSADAIGKDVRYPDFLARRMVAADKPVSVVSAGIGGNRLLAPGLLPIFGPAGLSRLQQDVISVPGATDVLMLIGINDLGLAPFPNASPVINGMKTAIGQFRQAGLRVVVGTLLPSNGYALYGMAPHGRPSVETARQQVNQWIRSSGWPDAVVDFDACLRDPASPSRLLPAYDSGDHIHPGAKGYEAMAACVDLNLFH